MPPLHDGGSGPSHPARLTRRQRALRPCRRSRNRAPVGHVFAVQKQTVGLVVQTTGLTRARTKIGMAKLAYNLWRPIQLRGCVTA